MADLFGPKIFSNGIPGGATPLGLTQTFSVVGTSIINFYTGYTSAMPGHSEGTFFYDSSAKTLAFYNENSNVKMNILGDGPRVYNATGATLPNGYMARVVGQNAGFPTVELATADPASDESTAENAIGILTVDIPPGEYGYLASAESFVNDVNTVAFAAAVGETWADGDVLYVSPTNPGLYTKTRPAEPNHSITAGILIKHSATVGKIFVIASHKNAINKKTKFNGIENPALVSVAYQADTRTTTVTYGAGAAIWVSGVRYAKPTTETVVHDTTNGKQYIYWDSTGVLVASTTTWDIITTAQCIVVYYKHNATPALAKALVFDDRHPGGNLGFNEYDHRYKHIFFSTQLSNYPVISGYTLSSSANLPYAVTSCTVEDEDLKTTLAAQTDGGNYPLLWLDSGSGTWNWDFTSSTNGLNIANGNMRWNNPVDGSLNEVTTNSRWINMWPIATPILGYVTGSTFTAYTGYMYITGQILYTTAATATAATPAALLYVANLTEEGSVFARMTYQRTSGNIVIYVDPVYYKGTIFSSSSSTFIPTDHQSLSNRSATGAHPSSAIAPDITNFNGLLTSLQDTAQKALDRIDDYASCLVQTKDVDYSILVNDFYIRSGTLTADRAYTLPAASTMIGKKICIKKTDSSVYTVTVLRTGADTIDGAASAIIGLQNDTLLLIASASGVWEIIGRATPALQIKSVTTTYTQELLYNWFNCSATADYALTLLTAVGKTGQVFTFKFTSNTGFAVTLTPAGSETIDGLTSTVLQNQYETVTLVSDGTNWMRE